MDAENWVPWTDCVQQNFPQPQGLGYAFNNNGVEHSFGNQFAQNTQTADIWNQTTPTTNVAMQQNGECFFMRQYSHFPLNNFLGSNNNKYNNNNFNCEATAEPKLDLIATIELCLSQLSSIWDSYNFDWNKNTSGEQRFLKYYMDVSFHLIKAKQMLTELLAGPSSQSDISPSKISNDNAQASFSSSSSLSGVTFNPSELLRHSSSSKSTFSTAPGPPSHLPIQQQIGQNSTTKKVNDHCGFCKTVGRPEDVYKSHRLKDNRKRIICPYLYEHSCEICGATGSQAHTQRYCPRRKLHQPRKKTKTF